MEHGKKCGCLCHKMKGLLIVAFGTVFLLNAFAIISSSTLAIVWPIIAIVYGFKKMCSSSMCKCCSTTTDTPVS